MNERAFTDRVLRLPEVMYLTGLSNSTIWRKEKNNDFPKRVKISTRAVGWWEKAILDWIENLSYNESNK
jgi:prophage regulatory protein